MVRQCLCIAGKIGDNDKEPVQTVVGKLLERLLEAWAECTPGQLSTQPDSAAVQCCESILDCTSLLLDRLMPGVMHSFHEFRPKLLQHVLLRCSSLANVTTATCSQSIVVSKLEIECIAGDDQSWAGPIIKKVAPHVPVSAPVIRTSAAVTESLVKINVSSAKLLTRFLLSSNSQVQLFNFWQVFENGASTAF